MEFTNHKKLDLGENLSEDAKFQCEDCHPMKIKYSFLFEKFLIS